MSRRVSSILFTLLFFSPIVTFAADTQAPTAPVTVWTDSGSTSTINVNWTPATDDVGVVEYEIRRCPGFGCANFTVIGSTSGTSYADSGLASGGYIFIGFARKT
ncbi:MAG: fibronectin type III domain-containing protein [Candidatus Moraniibacteriota bacterium]|nr:MAG: fibronectin type III domain-containing protein [Candidatus Moranbacteria bacterium]